MCPDWAIFKCLSDKSRGLLNPSECFISGILVPYDKLKSVYDIEPRLLFSSKRGLLDPYSTGQI